MKHPTPRIKSDTTRPEQFRVTLNLIRLLQVLLARAPHPCYGLELTTTLKLSSGAVYGMLGNLQQAGLVVCETEDIDERAAGRRKRRLWTLTEAGREYALHEIQAVQDLLTRPAGEHPTESVP